MPASSPFPRSVLPDAMHNLRSAADYMQDVAESIDAILYADGADPDADAAPQGDALDPLGDASGPSHEEWDAPEPEITLTSADDEASEFCGSFEDAQDPEIRDDVRAAIASARGWWAFDVEFADKTVCYTRDVLGALLSHWEEELRTTTAATPLATDPDAARFQPVPLVSAEQYMREALMQGLRLMWALLGDILPFPFLPDPYEVETANVTDLWHHVAAVAREYRACAARLNDTGRAFQMMLVIGEPEGGRWAED